MYFVFFRHWIGFSKSFPFGEFDNVGDDEMGVALEQLAQRWSQGREAEIAQAREEQHRRRPARRHGTADYTGMPMRPALPDKPREGPVDFDELLDIAGWRSGRMYAPPSGRTFVAELEDEHRARHIAAVLQARSSDKLFGRRFAVSSADKLGAATADLARLQINDARQKCQLPFAGQRHPLFQVLLDVDRLCGEGDECGPRDGDAVEHESDQQSEAAESPADERCEVPAVATKSPGRPKADAELDQMVKDYIVFNSKQWPAPAEIARELVRDLEEVQRSLRRLSANKSLQKSRATKGRQAN
jgi:hypothetical protein